MRKAQIKWISLALMLVVGVPLGAKLAWQSFGPPYPQPTNDAAAELNRLETSLREDNKTTYELYQNLSPFHIDRNVAVQWLETFFFNPNLSKYSQCYLELAKRNLNDPKIANEALLQAIRLSHENSAKEAVQLYVEKFSDSPMAAQLPFALNKYDLDFATEQLLAMNSNTHSNKVHAAILLTLGSLYKAEGRVVDAVDFLRKAEQELSALDPAQQKSSKAQLDAELDDLHKQGIDVAAAEIVGQIQDGTTVRLSDFKKKVIFLDFWGDW